MSPTPDRTLDDLRETIADLKRQLAESNAERDHLRSERDEALEQQTATTEVLQVINSSPGDLAPVFEAMLDKAMRLCEAAFGLLLVPDGELQRAIAHRALPPALAEYFNRPVPGGVGLVGRLQAGEAAVQVADAADDEIYRVGAPTRRALVDLGGARTAMAVALRKDGAYLGAFWLYRREVSLFTEVQIALLQNFAAQAVVAMENARLITETREALEQQTATAEVLQVINSSPGDLTPVFDAILKKAMHLCQATFGAMLSYDGGKLFAIATRGLPLELVDVWRAPAPVVLEGDTPYARYIRGERFVHVLDMAAEEVHPLLPPRSRALVEIGGARTGLELPLRAEGALLGSIWFYRKEVRPFSDKQIALLENFAAQAVIAMENARLLTETREALEQQTATAEVLQVINSSPGDLTPVFDATLEKALRLCGATFGVLLTYDGNQFQSRATRGVPTAYAEFLTHNPLTHNPQTVDPGTIAARIMGGEPHVHTVDLMADNVYLAGELHRRAIVELGGARTSLVVPLAKDQAILGSIQIYRKEVREFSEKQITLLKNFAAQAVIAIENARLLGELRQRTEEVGELNRDLEARVAAQVDELGRVGRLKRFLAPQLAELIVSQGDEKILESHRREIVVVFCDLRGYTAFTETAEPEEVLDFLREYHGALGPLVSQFEGTLDQFSGDGIMVFFNDPVPCPDPAERAVKMAMAMREAARELIAAWSRHGCELGFGIGIAQGYATLGQIGFSERSGYTAIGTVCNLAARLCAEAQGGQILVSSRVAGAVGALARLEELGNVELKGLRRPVAAFNVVESTSPGDARPNLTVVANGPGA